MSFRNVIWLRRPCVTSNANAPTQTTAHVTPGVWSDLSFGKAIWVALGAATFLFYVGNLMQFRATAAAEYSGYAVVVIALVSALTTAVWDSLRRYQEGTLAISWREIAAVLLATGALALLASGTHRG
jgi:hypothetical protein